MSTTRSIFVTSLQLFVVAVNGANNDLFNYGYTSYSDGRTSYGQPNWGSITCDDPSCTGFAEKYPFTPFDFDESLNNCRWCPASGDNDACGLHRQSPVNLKRDRAIINGTNYKECPDWHYMQTRDDTCSFEDLVNGFSIERHALRLAMPQLPDGQIACEEFGQRLYPRLDYSKGFPNWWFMQRVEIMAPAQHTQEGTKYAAEVILEHFYELDHYKNQLGHVSIFLQDYEGAESWAFLDKLICHWRIAEDKVREQCGLPPATPYGRCQLFRNQTPTPEWIQEQSGEIFDVEETRQPLWNFTQPPHATDAPTPPPTTLSPIAPKAPTSVIRLPTSPVVVKPVAMVPVIPPVAPAPNPIATVPWTVRTPAAAPITKATGAPIVASTGAPIVATTRAPRTPPTPPPAESIQTIQCNAWDINFPRMCHSDEDCCGDVRSDTEYCLDIYEQLGGAIAAACFQCCEEPQNAGPMAPIRDDLPLTLKCSDLDNVPNRMCQQDSCCSNPRANSDYCNDQYDKFSDNELEQICHYCCSTPMDIGPFVDSESNDNNNNRNLRSVVRVDSKSTDNQKDLYITSKLEGAKLIDVLGKKFLLSKENFDPIEEDEDEYFNRRYAEHKRRNLQQVHLENYDDVEWDPYEWLFRVETEYYFRYEGTMLVPPCWEVVHWRNMKDPIVVHKRQIAEIHRLLAHRVNPDNCARESAGIISPDGNSITSPREIQYMHEQHRFVFCECPDWPSKFKGDREWCHKHTEDVNYTRFYKHPYSFSSTEGWSPLP